MPRHRVASAHIGDPAPAIDQLQPVAPRSTLLADDLPPAWDPRPGPSARELGYHAIRTQLLSIRSQVESVLAQLAAMQAGPAASAADPRLESRTASVARDNVFGRIREKQRGVTIEEAG